MAGKKEKVVATGGTFVPALAGKKVKDFGLLQPIDDFGEPLRKLSELRGAEAEARYTVAITGGVGLAVAVIAVRRSGQTVFIPLTNVASFELEPD